MFSVISTQLNTWRSVRSTVRELSRLTDRELNDLGINRGDVQHVARFGRV